MKDQYLGDINDYLKYGLIRAFARQRLETLLCWMLTPPDGTAEGNRTGYLAQPEPWRGCDGTLFDGLAALVRSGRRSVAAFEDAGLLARCRFHAARVPDGAAARGAWFADLLERSRGADVLLFDPDNGLNVPSCRYGRSRSSKYLFRDEVRAAWQAGHSLVVFQHHARRERLAFVGGLCDELVTLADGAPVAALVGRHVVYLVVPQRGHAAPLGRALADFRGRFAPALVAPGAGRPVPRPSSRSRGEA